MSVASGGGTRCPWSTARTCPHRLDERPEQCNQPERHDRRDQPVRPEHAEAVAFCSATVMIWSSCLEPVPPILNWLSGAALMASTYSLAVLYDLSAFTQSTNSSSAIIATGVMSFQLKGMPVPSGVVNRFDSVMISL